MAKGEGRKEFFGEKGRVRVTHADPSATLGHLYLSATISKVDNKVRHFFCRSILLAYPFSLIAQAGSVWTCLVIAFDRFIAVFLPVQKRVWATPRTSTIFICGVALFAIVIQKVREAYRTLKQPMHSNTTRRR
ncbi:hypothetical protein GCK32_007137 [Trichostrongylus colubriformis]|uniref:G-protein coupled receptors family 1 profile domain-containing protein n=1 Tax=Trichostrongylus colubriformis TaxID=6319 RepID=A0AAN8IE80_TRICO